MHNEQQSFDSPSRTIWGAVTTALAKVVVFALTVMFTQSTQAQTFQVIYTFPASAQDGVGPNSLTIDNAGNLYGTTYIGGYTGGSCNQIGYPGCGTIFNLSEQGSGWLFTLLHSFTGVPRDGANPTAAPTIAPPASAPTGGLYGTTPSGASCQYCGTVYNFVPSPISTPLVSWTEVLLYQFAGSPDGQLPNSGKLIFDHNGNFYGMTQAGGQGEGWGTIYKMTHSGGAWTESVLYSFAGGSDGWGPMGGLIFDNAGNLYGTTEFGGSPEWPGDGTIFQLVPSGNGWSKNILYRFQGRLDGALPEGSLILDASGNLYGTTTLRSSGFAANASVFMLSPQGSSWSFKSIHSFFQ